MSGSAGRSGSDVVEVSIVVAARRSTVWRCVTERDLLSRWMQAGVSLEPRVGAPVTIDFARYGTVVEGVVEEVTAAERLVFTWGVSTGADAAAMPVGSTRVTLSLADDAGGGTLVTLRHAGLPSEKSRRDHAFGWTGYLGSLAGVAPLANVEGGVEALWDRWFAAWAEMDGAKRAAQLASCCEGGVSFMDTHAQLAGTTALAGWIGACQGMFPGVVMTRSGPVLHTRGALFCEWEARAPGGAVMARGVNHGRLSPEGLLAGVEGFWRA